MKFSEVITIDKSDVHTKPRADVKGLNHKSSKCIPKLGISEHLFEYTNGYRMIHKARGDIT